MTLQNTGSIQGSDKAPRFTGRVDYSEKNSFSALTLRSAIAIIVPFNRTQKVYGPHSIQESSLHSVKVIHGKSFALKLLKEF